MSIFDNFISQLKNAIVEFAEDSWNQFKDDAIADCNDFINQTKEDLENWTNQLAQKQITLDDFEWLIKGKKDLALLILLKQRGLAKAELMKFTNGLIDTIISTAAKVFI